MNRLLRSFGIAVALVGLAFAGAVAATNTVPTVERSTHVQQTKTHQDGSALPSAAPRVTAEHVDQTIVAETFTTLPSGKVMVCELTLRNGFTVRGEAAVVSKANFVEEVGRSISRANARSKVWELEGYLLQQRLSETAGAEA